MLNSKWTEPKENNHEWSPHLSGKRAHREKKFIEHDQDIDVGILGNEFNKIKNVMKKYNSLFYLEHYFPKNRGINNASEISYRHKGTNVKIDIFQVLKTPKGYLHYSYGSICSKKKIKDVNFSIKLNLKI